MRAVVVCPASHARNESGWSVVGEPVTRSWVQRLAYPNSSARRTNEAANVMSTAPSGKICGDPMPIFMRSAMAIALLTAPRPLVGRFERWNILQHSATVASPPGALNRRAGHRLLRRSMVGGGRREGQGAGVSGGEC